MGSAITNPVFRNLLRGILVWAPLWIGTMILFGALGTAYVMFLKQDAYLASQAIMVRDEANGAIVRLGRFQSQSDMKAAQETILETAKSHQVVRSALESVGPAPKLFPGWSFGAEEEFPSLRLIDETARRAISVHAPKGAEFGVTEVIYIDVTSTPRDRALALNLALCEALEARLQQVRRARADSVIAELTHARELARNELAASTEQLHAMELEAGTDLSDLRGMIEFSSSSSSTRLEFDQIKNELRQTEQTLQQLRSDRDMLLAAIEDPAAFVVAPSALLNSQPGLKRLREGLVDAQLSGSQLTGKFTDDHPLVIAANSAQSTIIQRFSEELRASLASIEADVTVAEQNQARLEAKKKSLEMRLTQLTNNRAQYSNFAAEVKSRVSILESAERALAEALAARDSSQSTSLLTRLDAPIVSDKPIGPGRLTLIAVCAAAGLAFGLGIVVLITPLDSGPTYGRRISDRFQGRRQADRVPAATSPLPASPELEAAFGELARPPIERRGASSDPNRWNDSDSEARMQPRPANR